ncbi:MAG: RNA-binding domain-containing protein [Eggerthellaceae bacterium]
MDEKLKRYIAAGEGLNLEFKRCGGNPERDVFETICSFANRQGGSILLGVLDDGTVSGVPPAAFTSIERNIVNVVNDPKQFNITPSLEFEKLEGEGGAVVIRVWVPMGPALYSYKGIVYDRIADVDTKIRTEAQQAAMIIRKQGYYTEKTVYPWVTEEDLDFSLLEIIRKEVRTAREQHPWLSLSNDELVRAARLYSRDPATGNYGFNLAAVMLIGKQETILDVAPVYRTDVILRRSGTDRYDDRLVCTKNLVEAYGEISSFCRKWLPDSFALGENGNRLNVRDVIIRELVTNSLIHREYTSPHIARITIDPDGIRTHNASRALFAGPVTPDNLDPTPKNPIIANIFTQMGRSEELGSGVRNLYKCSKLFTGLSPQIEDGDFFDAFVPIPPLTPGSTTANNALESHDDKARPKKAFSEVEAVVDRLLKDHGEIAASEVSAEVRSIGERMVRRYLAKMVDEGTLSTERRGRSTVYWRPK